jgi:hypothetical protein
VDASDLHRNEEVTVWVPQSMFDAQPAAAGHSSTRVASRRTHAVTLTFDPREIDPRGARRGR